MEHSSRRFLRELDKALEGNNLQYILKCSCIPFFGNQGLHNEIVLGGNGGRSGVMYERSPYISLTSLSLFLFPPFLLISPGSSFLPLYIAI